MILETVGKPLATGQFNANEAMSRVEITISSLDTNYLYAVSCGRDRGLFGFLQKHRCRKYLDTNNKCPQADQTFWSGAKDADLVVKELMILPFT